jgi:hypothetical protein
MSGSTSALRAIASGTVVAPQYQKYVEKAREKANKESENLKTVEFHDPILQAENLSHQKKYQREQTAFVAHYPYICTLSSQLATFHTKVSEDNEGFKNLTKVVTQDELSRLQKTSEDYTAEFYTLLTAMYEASTFAQNFFQSVKSLNTEPLTFAPIGSELSKLKKPSLPESITSYLESVKQLQLVKDERFQVAEKLSAQVGKTMIVISKNLIKVIEKLGLYMQTVSYKGLPLKNTWTGAVQSAVLSYDIPVPKGFAIKTSDSSSTNESSSGSSTLSSKVSSVASNSTLISTMSSSIISVTTSKDLENKRKEKDTPMVTKGWTKKNKEREETEV